MRIIKYMDCVSIYLPTIAPYRIQFYSKLQSKLNRNGIKLTLHAIRNNGEARDNAAQIPNTISYRLHRRRRVNILGYELSITPTILSILKSDVIIIQGATGVIDNWIILLFSKILRKKVYCWTLLWEKEKQSVLLAFVKRIAVSIYFRLASGVICYNSKTLNFFTRNQKNKNAFVVHNGIDLDDYKASVQIFADQTRHESSGKKYLYIGGLSENKNIRELIRAFQDPRLSDCELTLIGSGQQSGLVKSASDVVPNISFLGRIDSNKAELFRSSHCCIMPGEGGLFLLESVLWKKPVLYFSGDGCELDFLEDGVNSLKIPGTSYEDIIETVLKYKTLKLSEVDNYWPLNVANTDVMAERFYDIITKNMT